MLPETDVPTMRDEIMTVANESPYNGNLPKGDTERKMCVADVIWSLARRGVFNACDNESMLREGVIEPLRVDGDEDGWVPPFAFTVECNHLVIHCYEPTEREVDFSVGPADEWDGPATAAVGLRFPKRVGCAGVRYQTFIALLDYLLKSEETPLRERLQPIDGVTGRQEI